MMRFPVLTESPHAMYTCVEDLKGERKDGCARCGQTAPMPSIHCPVNLSTPEEDWVMVYDPSDHRWRSKCTVVYALEEPPVFFAESIFLAGPTPRRAGVQSWRPAAIQLLRLAGFKGIIYVPEPRSGEWGSYDHQVEWEERFFSRAKIIMFWVPRKMATMPALTTNDEWATWRSSSKVVLGFPEDADDMRYQHRHACQLGVPVSHTLTETVGNALALMAQNTVAECVFCQIAGPDRHNQVEWRGRDSVVITPLNPLVAGHRLVIPRVHVNDAFERPNVLARVMRDASVYANSVQIGDCNVSTSVGRTATQAVFHLHVHLVPRTEGDGLHLPWTGQKK